MAQTAAAEAKTGLYGKLKFMGWDGVYQVASTRIGQRAFSLIDRLLCVLEAVYFYDAPKHQQDEARQHTKASHTERPLPWTLYLPVLLLCRVVRQFVSLGAKLTHKKFEDITAVYFIQSWRTTMKAIKLEGARIHSDPKRRVTALPWPLRFALNLVIWGPLQIVIVVTNLVVGNKSYHSYAVSGQPRSKRYLKKLKSTPANECNTLELLDKLADEDDQDDPDFELKSTDLVSDTDDEDDDDDDDVDDDLLANSGAEEDGQVRENGSPKGDNRNGNGNGTGNGTGHDNNHQNNDGHHQENNHQEQHHHEEHHHY